MCCASLGRCIHTGVSAPTVNPARSSHRPHRNRPPSQAATIPGDPANSPSPEPETTPEPETKPEPGTKPEPETNSEAGTESEPGIESGTRPSRPSTRPTRPTPSPAT